MTPMFDPDDIDIRSSRYFVASTVRRCARCGGATLLAALCLPPGHEVREVDDDAPEDSDGIWRVADRHALLFHIDNLCPATQKQLRTIAPCYAFCRSDELGSYWANHCEHCGSQLDDNELFCEPEGGFLPTSEGSARLIQLTAIGESIEARAAGVADEPEFFDCMRRT